MVSRHMLWGNESLFSFHASFGLFVPVSRTVQVREMYYVTTEKHEHQAQYKEGIKALKHVFNTSILKAQSIKAELIKAQCWNMPERIQTVRCLKCLNINWISTLKAKEKEQRREEKNLQRFLLNLLTKRSPSHALLCKLESSGKLWINEGQGGKCSSFRKCERVASWPRWKVRKYIYYLGRLLHLSISEKLSFRCIIFYIFYPQVRHKRCCQIKLNDKSCISKWSRKSMRWDPMKSN